MKVETDAVLVVFWRCAEMVQKWLRLVGRSLRERRCDTGYKNWSLCMTVVKSSDGVSVCL